MMIVNTDYITGKQLETLSLVRGSTVHSKNIGRDIMSSFKTLVGGEIKDYTDMMNEARAIATQRMIEDAERLGADAIVNVRFASSAIMAGAAEIIAYGTAVKFI
ncbi:MAG: YbjQ family protein [Negativibacillus sp.]|nr:YbjQ family protein [Negativibacillus sp.]